MLHEGLSELFWNSASLVTSNTFSNPYSTFTVLTKAGERKGSAMINYSTKIACPDVVLLKFFTSWREYKKIQKKFAAICKKNEKQDVINNAKLWTKWTKTTWKTFEETIRRGRIRSIKALTGDGWWCWKYFNVNFSKNKERFGVQSKYSQLSDTKHNTFFHFVL